MKKQPQNKKKLKGNVKKTEIKREDTWLKLCITVLGFIAVYIFMEFLVSPVFSIIQITGVIKDDYILDVIQLLLQAAAAYLAVKLFTGKDTLKKIGIKKELNLNKVIVIILSGIAASVVINMVIYALKGYTFKAFIWDRLYSEDIVGVLLVGIIDAAAVAVYEEITTRGFIFKRFAEKNRDIAIILTAVTFTAIHILDYGFNAAAAIGLMLFSILLSLIFILTDNLLYNIIFYIVWYYSNTYIFSPATKEAVELEVAQQGIIMYDAGSNWLVNGGMFGVRASIVFIILILIVDIFLYLRVRRSKI